MELAILPNNAQTSPRSNRSEAAAWGNDVLRTQFFTSSSYFIYLALKIISLKSNSALFWKANPGFHLLCGLFSILMESTAVFSALAANAKKVARDAYHSRILHPPMQTFDPF
jgi:hypothetical protein